MNMMSWFDIMIYSLTSLIRPPFIRISLLSGRDLAVIFFLCVYNNYGEMGDFKSFYNKMISFC